MKISGFTVYCFTLGKPVDKKDAADYIPTVSVYSRTEDTLKQAQKEECVRRLEKRRALVDKENQSAWWRKFRRR